MQHFIQNLLQGISEFIAQWKAKWKRSQQLRSTTPDNVIHVRFRKIGHFIDQNLKQMNNGERLELELSLPPKIVARLQQLQSINGTDSLTGTAPVTETVRRSLALYDILLVEAFENGGEVIIHYKNGGQKKIEIF